MDGKAQAIRAAGYIIVRKEYRGSPEESWQECGEQAVHRGPLSYHRRTKKEL